MGDLSSRILSRYCLLRPCLVELVASGKVLSGLSRWKHLNVFKNNRFFFFRKLSTANASTSPAETHIKKVSFRRLVTGEEWGGGVEGNNQSSSSMLALETFI